MKEISFSYENMGTVTKATLFFFHLSKIPNVQAQEHIPLPYDNLFQSILSSHHAVEVIFSLGPIVTQAMANCHQVVSI